MVYFRESFKLRFLVVGVTAAFILTSPLVLAKEKKHNLQQMIKAAGENVEKADEELKEKEAAIRNEKREAKIRKHFERGNALYKEGKLKEAKKEWQKVLAVSKDPQMKNYIRESEKRAKAEEVTRKKEEREKQKRIETETRRQKTEDRKDGIEQAKLEKERQAQIKKQEKEEQKRIEAEKREKERLERERKRQVKKEEKQKKGLEAKKKRLIRKEQKRLEKKKKEKEREELERKKNLETEKREKGKLVRKEQKRIEAEKKRTERERLKDERAKQKKEEREKKKLEQKKQRELKRQQRVKVKETAKDSEEATKIKLEDLNYKTEKECLDALEKKPEDRKAFDNLVKLYRLQNKCIERGKEFHKKGDYQSAIKEFKRVLAIEPGNKKVIRWMKKAKGKVKP